jgi:hypothetical protein
MSLKLPFGFDNHFHTNDYSLKMLYKIGNQTKFCRKDSGWTTEPLVYFLLIIFKMK